MIEYIKLHFYIEYYYLVISKMAIKEQSKSIGKETTSSESKNKKERKESPLFVVSNGRRK